MDEPRSDETLRRQTSLTIWLVAALLLLIVGMVGFSLFGPNPPIEIGLATTRITTPLDANGLPDYAAVLLADSRKGVTPENNGAVPFLMAMWPEKRTTYAYSAEGAKLLCSELGLPEIPPVKTRVTSTDSDKNRLAVLRLLRERLPKPENHLLNKTKESLEELDRDDDEGFFTLSESEAVRDIRVLEFLVIHCEPVRHAWTAEDLPFLAEWVEENNVAIDLLVKAAEQPEWHFPTPSLIRGGSGAVAKTYYNSVHWPRNAAEYLTTRSGFYRGNGDFSGAARDAIAVLRLAHHTSKGPFFVNQLVAIAIGGGGLSLIDQIAADEAVPVSILHQILANFNQLGSFGRMAYAINRGERFLSLDLIISSSIDNVFGKTGLPDGLSSIPCDRNPCLRAYNVYFDSAVAATKLPTWVQRQAAWSQVDSIANAGDFPPLTIWELPRLLTAKGRGKILAQRRLGQNGGWIQPLLNAEDRATTNRQLTRLGIALAIHCAEQGAYPELLDELVPDILPKLPVDLFHNNPFAYHKTNEGYLLYSFGANGTDERASNRSGVWGSKKLEGTAVEEPAWGEEDDESSDTPYAKIPAGADDLSLRVPLPEPEPWPWERNN